MIRSFNSNQTPPQTGPNSGSGGGRFSQLVNSLPFTTRLIMGICIALQIFSWLTDYLNNFVICPGVVIYYNQWWRILSSAFFHNGLLHIAMNMMSFHFMGRNLESKFGSLCLFALILQFAVLTNLLYVGVTWAIFKASTNYSWLNYCSVGFSGVLFSLVVVDTRVSTRETRSLFGFCMVPSWLYPWILLLVLQIVMPNISFLGHLSGIVIGLLYIRGLLNWLSLNRQKIISIENSSFMSKIAGLSWYMKCPSQDALDYRNSCSRDSCNACFEAIKNCYQPASVEAPANPSSQGRTFPKEGGYRLGGKSTYERVEEYEMDDEFGETSNP